MPRTLAWHGGLAWHDMVNDQASIIDSGAKIDVFWPHKTRPKEMREANYTYSNEKDDWLSCLRAGPACPESYWVVPGPLDQLTHGGKKNNLTGSARLKFYGFRFIKNSTPKVLINLSKTDSNSLVLVLLYNQHL